MNEKKGRYVPLPRGMSPGFYAFMSPGSKRREDGALLMWIEDKDTGSSPEPTHEPGTSPEGRRDGRAS